MDFNPSGVVSAGTLYFFKKKYPYYAKVNQPYRKDERKMRKYNRFSIAAIFIVMFYLFTVPILLAAILSIFAKGIHTVLTPEGVTYYTDSWMMYLLTSLPLTLGLLIWLYKWTFQLMLQSDYPEYEDFYNDKQGYDNHKAGVLVSRPLLILALITAFFSFGSRFTTSDKEIKIRRFFDIKTRTYAYSDVQEVIHYKKPVNNNGGMFIDDPYYYMVVFSDGFTLNPEMFTQDYEKGLPFIKTVIAKSGKKIIEREAE